MLADVVDAVVGGDTHRDTHTLELTAPTGTPIATLRIRNDAAGFARAVTWIAEHAPGPRVVAALEGTRSYGVGLARALQAAGLTVVEVERPRRGERRRGKSDPIDARLAALHRLRLDADRLPKPRADGDREALRILLGARRELATRRRLGPGRRCRVVDREGQRVLRPLVLVHPTASTVGTTKPTLIRPGCCRSPKTAVCCGISPDIGPGEIALVYQGDIDPVELEPKPDKLMMSRLER
jgi:Transposase